MEHAKTARGRWYPDRSAVDDNSGELDDALIEAFGTIGHPICAPALVTMLVDVPAGEAGEAQAAASAADREAAQPARRADLR
jgi:hypothetical protein